MKRKLLVLTLLLFVFSSCHKSPSRKKGQSKSVPTSSLTTSIPHIDPVEGFGFSPANITVDLKDSDTGFVKCFNTANPSANIEWIVPSSNILRLQKISTTSGEINSFSVFNIGSVTIQGRIGSETTSCVINVVNTASRKTSGTELIQIYAVNDYHGHVNEHFNLKKYGTFIKEKMSQPNTLFLDQGDTWQGSLESNYNRGHMITDVYNAAGVSARTVGNHDFDWGISELAQNTSSDYHGYATPVLAANVYDFDWKTKQVGTTQQSNIGQEYTTYTLKSGIKVGIIGTISETCEPDITTSNIMNVEFTPIINKIKELSDILRVEESCDIVISSMHEGYFDNLGVELTKISPVSNKRYIDLGLNGHTHQTENFQTSSNVFFAQFGGYGYTIGQIDLTYSYSDNTVSETSIHVLDTYQLSNEVQTIDSEINSIVDYYNAQTQDIGSEVLTTKLGDGFNRYVLPNMICKAMYEEAIREGYNVSYALCNFARMNLKGPTVTYSSLYEAIPFENVCYIVELSGKDAYNKLSNAFELYMYRGDTDDAVQPIDKNKEKYTFVIIDYVALHANTKREYDYIPSVNPIARLMKNGQTYNYCDVTADYIRSQSGEILSTSYSSEDIRHNLNMIEQPLY